MNQNLYFLQRLPGRLMGMMALMLFYIGIFSNPVAAQQSQLGDNVMTPITESTFSNLTATSSQFLFSDQFSPKGNVTDPDLGNSASWSFVAAGTAWLSVKDNNATGTNAYPGGSYAGFVINDGMISIGGTLTVATYRNGSLVESRSNASLLGVGILSGRSSTGFYTTTGAAYNFDEVRISYSAIGLGTMNVYYAVVQKYVAGPALSCNSDTRLNLPAYPMSVATTTSGVSLGVITNATDAISASTTDFALLNITAGVGATASIAIKDNRTTYSGAAGTFVGLEIENSNLLDLSLAGRLELRTYSNGVQQDSVIGLGSLVGASLLSGTAKQTVGFVTTRPVDEVKLTLNQPLGVSIGATRVYGAIFRSFCEADPLACNSVTLMNNEVYPVYINPARTGVSGLIGLNNKIENAANIIDNNNTTAAEVTVLAGVGNKATISVRKAGQVFAGGTFAGFEIANPQLVGAHLLSGITIRTYNKGVPQEVMSAASGALVSVSTTLLTGTGRQLVGFVTDLAKPFDEATLELENIAGLNLGATSIYGFHTQRFCQGAINCNGTYWLNSGDPANGGYPVVINNQRTGIDGTACVGCAIEGAGNVITPNTADYATFKMVGGVLSAGGIAVRDAVTDYPAQTVTGFAIKKPTSLLETTLLGAITITTYLNNVTREASVRANLMDLDVLGTPLIGTGADIYYIGFRTSLSFDEVRISMSGLVSADLLSQTQIYGAFVDTRYVTGGEGSGITCLVPEVTPASAAPVCQGNGVTLTSSATTGNQWYRNNTLIANATGQTFQATLSGSYTVIVTAAGYSGVASNAVVVTVNPAPDQPTVTASGPLTFCAGESVTLTSSSATGNQWYKDGVPIANAINATYAAGTTGSYTVVATGDGCAGPASAGTAVVVQPVPPAPEAGTLSRTNPTTCAGTDGSISITGYTAATAYTVSYTRNAAPVTATITADGSGILVIAGLGVGVYSHFKVAYPATGCGAAPYTGTLTLTDPSSPAQPTITASGTTNLCAGGSVTLTSSSANNNQWYKDGLPISSATGVTYIANASGNYTVVVTAGGCSSPASLSVPVTVTPIPAQPVITASGPTTFCAGDQVILSSSAAVGNQWHKDGAPVSNATGQTYTATMAGNYTLVVTTAGCVSPASGTTSVVVNPVPPDPGGATVGGNHPTTCSATDGNITIAGYTAATAYTVNYTRNGNPLSANLTASGSGLLTLPGLGAGTYSDFKVSYPGSGCGSAVYTGIVVLADPNAPARPTVTSSGSTTLCEGGSVFLISSSASGNQWYKDGAPVTNATNANYLASATGTYTVMVTTGGCVSPVSVGTVVTINPVPPTPAGMNVDGTNPTICSGTNGTITMTGYQASTDYLVNYTFNGIPATASVTSDGSGVLVLAGLSAGDYSAIKVSYPSGCASGLFTGIVTLVDPIGPGRPVITASGPTGFCTGGQVTLSASSSTAYQWYKDGQIIANATGQTYIAGASGSYTVVVAMAGCASSASDPVLVVANPLPVVTWAGPLPAQSVTTTYYTLSGALPAGGTYSGDGVSGGVFNPQLAGIGTHTITYIYTNSNGCSNIASLTITVTAGYPDVENDHWATMRNVGIVGNVSINDKDPQGAVLSYDTALVVKPTRGNAVLLATGVFGYFPDAFYTGVDSFAYRVCNSPYNLCDVAWVYVSVLPPGNPGGDNRVPLVQNDEVTTFEGVAVASDASSNDLDPDENALTYAVVRGPSKGNINLGPDGKFTYIPTAGQTGMDTIVYRACDDGMPSYCGSAMIVVNIIPEPTAPGINDAPYAHDDVVWTLVNTSLSGNVLANDYDLNGQTLTAAVVGTPPVGLVFQPNGDFTYTPPTDFTGTIAVTYAVTDNGIPALSDTASLVIVVVYTNSVLAGVIAGDQDVCYASDPVAFSVLTPASGAGTLTYQWQSSTTTADCGPDGFTNIANGTGATYNPPAGILQTTYYRLIVTSNLNGTLLRDTTNCVVVRVGARLTGSINGTVTVPTDAATSSPVTLTGIGGIPPYTFTYNINGGSTQTAITTGNHTSVELTQSHTTAGTYVYTLLSIADTKGCPSLLPAENSATVTVVEPSGLPDLEPIITMFSPSFTNTTLTRPFNLNLYNIGNGPTIGAISIFVVKPTLTGSSISFNLPEGWTLNEQIAYYELQTTTAVINGGGAAAAFSGTVTLNPSVPLGTNTLQVYLPLNTGGDNNDDNNASNIELNKTAGN